jgi:hypothetical protein
MSLVRVHNFSISLDGFGTGEGQSHCATSSVAVYRLVLAGVDWVVPGGPARIVGT